MVRDIIANAYPFSWLKRTDIVTTDTFGDADLPSTFNPNHKLQPGYVRIAGSGAYDDITLTEVGTEIFDRYDAAGSNFYTLDYNTSTNLYRLRTSEPSVTITVTYFHTPAIMSSDSTVCPVPDAQCVGYLASAKVWLAKERDETNHDRDNQLGLVRLERLIINDKRANPLRPLRGSIWTRDLGFNSR